jgi:hypothetical protein
VHVPLCHTDRCHITMSADTTIRYRPTHTVTHHAQRRAGCLATTTCTWLNCIRGWWWRSSDAKTDCQTPPQHHHDTAKHCLIASATPPIPFRTMHRWHTAQTTATGKGLHFIRTSTSAEDRQLHLWLWRRSRAHAIQHRGQSIPGSDPWHSATQAARHQEPAAGLGTARLDLNHEHSRQHQQQICSTASLPGGYLKTTQLIVRSHMSAGSACSWSAWCFQEL